MKSGRPVSILITSVHSSLNAGDLALLEMLAGQLRAAFAEPRITVLANWPLEPAFQQASAYRVMPSPWVLSGEGTGKPLPARILTLGLGALQAGLYRLGLRSCASRGWRDLFDAYRGADVVIGVGGNQFYSTGRYGWPFPVNISAVLLAHLFGRPFFTMPQSIGPFKRGWERWLMRQAYGRARLLFLRDHGSEKLARAIGIRPEIIRYAPDSAFGYAGAGRLEALAVLRRYGFEEGQPCLGVTCIAPMGRALDASHVERYYRAMGGLLRRLIEEAGLTVYFFNQVVGPTRLEDDREAVKVVLAHMGAAAERARWVNEALPPALLKACYGQMDLFIASRLHSGIFSMGAGVPTLLIGYLAKTRAVLQTMGLEDWVIALDEVSEERLHEMVLQAWAERAERATRLTALIPEQVEGASRVVEQIRRVLTA